MPGTIPLTGRGAAQRAATQKQIADKVAAMQAATAADRTFEWRRADGTPIDVPTFLADFANAVAVRISATEVELAGLRDEIGKVQDALQRNTELTEKSNKDIGDLIEIVKNAKGFGNTLKWMADLGKSMFWIAVALVAVGGMLYSQFFGPPPPDKTPRTASK